MVIYFIWSAIWGPEKEESEADAQLVEGLSEYYEALKLEDKSIIIGQEDYYKYNF